jgi:AcrR family transcriptional regulator
MVMCDQVRHRRRGQELENALLDAAWEELVTAGFASLTMESVAARAKTGVAVLYRRWPNKGDLVLAAIDHYRRAHPVEIPDTGTLRGDLLALLGGFSDGRSSFTTVMTAAFAGLQRDSGMTPAEVRGRIIEDRPVSSHEVYRRAHERGEIDLDNVPAAVLLMPFDLMRHDLLMTLRPVPPERITSIVDDLFLPLVAQFRPVPATAVQDLRRHGNRRLLSGVAAAGDAILSPCSAPARWSPSSPTGTSPSPALCPPMSCGHAGR